MAEGYIMLVTWPQMSGTAHVQDTWYAHIPDQTEAVRAVQNACGALNDAKIEILTHLSHDRLLELNIREGTVERAFGILDSNEGAAD